MDLVLCAGRPITSSTMDRQAFFFSFFFLFFILFFSFFFVLRASTPWGPVCRMVTRSSLIKVQMPANKVLARAQRFHFVSDLLLWSPPKPLKSLFPRRLHVLRSFVFYSLTAICLNQQPTIIPRTEGFSMANDSKPSRSAGRGATKAKSRTSRSRAGSPCSVRSTVSTSKADRNTLNPVAKLRKDLVCHSLSCLQLFVSFCTERHDAIFLR